jgi:NADPH2:quinone reductase
MASGVNPSDVKSRLGLIGKKAFPRVIPHSDGAGVIDQVGPGVDETRIGQRVWIWNAQWLRPFGSAAEYVVLAEAQAVPLPARTGFDAAACLGIPAMTAWHAVSRFDAASGNALLISGGAGAVSHYAIQFAKAAGFQVLTTISSPLKAELGRAAGADVAIDYRREDVAEAVKAHTDGQGVNGLIELDISANAPLLTDVMKPGGKVVAYGASQTVAPLPAFFCILNSISLECFLVYTLDARARAAAIAGIRGLLERDALIHNIAARFPLEQTVAAHELVESGKATGNVVVILGEAE